MWRPSSKAILRPQRPRRSEKSDSDEIILSVKKLPVQVRYLIVNSNYLKASSNEMINHCNGLRRASLVPMARSRHVALSVALVLQSLSLFADASSPVNVLTANYDNERTNANLKETILNPSNVGQGTFGKIGSFPVDGQIYAQPLYATGNQIAGKGIRNVVFTATMHNSVYTIDADDPASIAPRWQVNLG